MSAEIMDQWFDSGLFANINQLQLKPLEHKLLTGKPLSCRKGQAEVFFLTDQNGNWWLLKKFYSSCSLEREYLERISSILPDHDGFHCGTARQVLSTSSLSAANNNFSGNQLSQWLDNTVLMPHVNGVDWSTFADEIRAAKAVPNKTQRFSLCKSLAQLIYLLENNQCCHRDLSCGNVFIHTDTWQISLIDFDSMYHPSLDMPKTTTCGTTGYTAPYSWENNRLNPQANWTDYSDRFALSLLIAEFLFIEQSSKATAEGGIFDQDELKNKTGRGLDEIYDKLNSNYPEVAGNLKQTIESDNFSQCPSPQDWLNYFNKMPSLASLNLEALPEIRSDYFAQMLTKCRPAAPLWPAPSLDTIPIPEISLPKSTKRTPKPAAVSLPPDPWN